MGAAAKVTEIYMENDPLIERTRSYLKASGLKIGELAREINYSRSTLNLFLTGKHKSPAIAEKIACYLDKYDDCGNETDMPERTEEQPAAPSAAKEEAGSMGTVSKTEHYTAKTEDLEEALTEVTKPSARKRGGDNTAGKPGLFESNDARLVIGVCQSCQEYREMGIITGRSGYGKTYALKEYAKLQRVAYIECDVTMSTRDLLKSIERALGIPQEPHRAYGSHFDRINIIVDFLSVNKGYLIIVDEADKLMSRNSQNKMHILRAIFDRTAGDSDRSSCGIVIAGEPKLEAQIKMYLEQYAKRTIFGAELKGLSSQEVRDFLSSYEIEEEATAELIRRARNHQTGCFRLLDRTMRNVLRILGESGESVITLKIIEEASGYMML